MGDVTFKGSPRRSGRRGTLGLQAGVPSLGAVAALLATSDPITAVCTAALLALLPAVGAALRSGTLVATVRLLARGRDLRNTDYLRLVALVLHDQGQAGQATR